MEMRQLKGLTVVASAVALLLSLAPHAVVAQPGTALVGNWHGTWTSDQNPSRRGDVSLVITGINGNTVSGRLELTGSTVALFPVQGTFEANRLTFVSPDRQLRAEYDLLGFELGGKHYGPTGSSSVKLTRR